jgi:branched-chain amino acid transport system substrate-binding protein
VGLVSSSNQKDVHDVQWAEDAAVKEFFAFMKQYMPAADLNNSNYSAGYLYARLLERVLKACKDDFSSESIMRQATSLHEVPLPLLLPGITVTTGPDNYMPFRQLILRRFDGKSWLSFGNVLDDRWTPGDKS